MKINSYTHYHPKNLFKTGKKLIYDNTSPVRLTKFLNGEALNETFENKQLRIKLRKSILVSFVAYKKLIFSSNQLPLPFWVKGNKII